MAEAFNKILSDSEIRVGNRVLKKGETVFELLESIEETRPADPSRPQLMSEAELRQIITEATERIAREMVPAIAEKIIRDEIEKLKNS